MKFKSVLGAFLFVFLACFIAAILFIQTEYFAKVVTGVVSDISNRKFKTEVGFRKFSISFFPPGIELNQVKIKKTWSQLEGFEGEVGTLGLYFGLVEFEEKKLTFGEIKIADGFISIMKQKSSEKMKEIDQEIINNIFRFNHFSPLRIDKLTLENSKVSFNENNLDIQKLKLFKTSRSIIARFHVSNLQLQPMEGSSIDEIWGDTELTKKSLKVYRLKIQHDVHTALMKGEVKNYQKLLGSEFDVNGETQVFLKGLENYIPDSAIAISEGLMRANFTARYRPEDFSATADVYIEGARSSIIHADEVRSMLRLENQSLLLDTFELREQDQRISLEAPVVIYNLKQKSFLPGTIRVRAVNFALSNGLRAWRQKTKSLEGILSGSIVADVRSQGFEVKLDDQFTINNFSLTAGTKEKPFEIIRIKSAQLSQTKVLGDTAGVKLNTILGLAHSKIPITGYISPGKISFKSPASPIDLTDFGNISQLGITGAGDIALEVEGSRGDVQIHLDGKTKGFSVLGYRLGESEKDILIDLGASTVFINKLESKVGKTSLTGSGSVNYKNADIALGISTGEGSAHDLRDILSPIIGKASLPDDLDLKAKIDVDIFGKYKFPELKIRSRISFSDLVAIGETVNSGNLNLALDKEVLKLERIELNKGNGVLSGDVSLNLKGKSFLVKSSWENFELSSFDVAKRANINVQSTFSGKLDGGGSFDDYKLKIINDFFDTKNSSHQFPDSKISLTINPNRIAGDINLIGDVFTSKFDLSKKEGESSRAQFQLKSNDLRPILVMLAGPHLELENVSGSANLAGEASFEKGFKDLDLTFAVKNLNFNHPDFNISYASQLPQFVVRNGKIERWSLDLNQPDLTFGTSGRGVFGEKVTLQFATKINAKILEILSSKILSSDGHLENLVKVDVAGDKIDYSVTSKTSDLDLSIENLPVQIDNLKYSLAFNSKRLHIEQFVFAMENGSFNLKGDVFFDSDQPDVNLKFIFDKAEIPILGKSALNISGEGIVLGNNYPYSVGGEITINKAQVVNELNEFSKKSAGFSQVRFLPKTQESPLGKMFVLNLNVKAENPIRLTNSLMDVALTGELRLIGSPGRLRGEGRLSTPLNSSRIFFKNNEYIIQSADINFNPQKDIANPDFDVQAMTMISSYKIYPKAYGDLERFNFDLTSEPALPRNSILSLIAFGYTDEIQSSLYAKDQQSLTQVGVGSFVFDRFKISDILNKQFGLQVNLGTVIEQSATDSLLSGRNQAAAGGQGAGALGRTRSATKIELKKRLDEALTLSVSSTMGGTIGQRQSMNLNYGVSKNIQLEGVYELRTNEEGQADIIYNSIGGDLKFRRTFK
jgi:translocation and assembly module TamB